MLDNEYMFAFFPYLKTSEPINYRQITIMSSDDASNLPTDAIQHFEKLRKMFYWRDHLRIKEMSYTFHSKSHKLSNAEFINRLFEFQTLICFFYSSPNPISGEPFFDYENSSLYLLQPKLVFESLIRNDHNAEVLPEAQKLKFNEQTREGRL